MATTHKVQAGECIISIASRYQLWWEDLWNLPANAALKEKRKNPDVLREGDVVVIPSTQPITYSRPTAAIHPLTVKRPKTRLRLRVVVDWGPKPTTSASLQPPSTDRRTSVGEDPPPDITPRTDEPRVGLAYRVNVDGFTTEGTTDADGYVDCAIPPTATSGQLILAPDTPDETVLPLNLGHLDPIGEVSGVKQRLRNLCFDCGDQNDELTPDFSAALAAFQTKHGLEPTGTLDDATRAEILKAHGT